jgi:hypothetical protein
MAVFPSQRTTPNERDPWRVVDYAAITVIVGFLCIILFLLLVEVTHGWSANP